MPGGMQFNTKRSHYRKGEDILLLNVGALGLRPPAVSQVQQLQCEMRAVWNQVWRCVKITQEVSALTPVGPLERCRSRLR